MHPATATRDAAIPSVGSEELAEGLMLVRASTLKMIRLQLAMERRDQRVALEAVDDLVALDRCLEELLSHHPNPYEKGLLRSALEQERSALNVEKHTLAASFSKSTWKEPQELPSVEEEWAPYRGEPYEFEAPRWWRVLLVALLLVAVASAAYFLGASTPAQEWLKEVL